MNAYIVDDRDVIHSWFPHVEDHLVPGVGHSLQMEDPEAAAEAIADFLGRHPVGEGLDASPMPLP